MRLMFMVLMEKHLDMQEQLKTAESSKIFFTNTITEQKASLMQLQQESAACAQREASMQERLAA